MSAQYTPGPWAQHLGRSRHPRFHVQTFAGYQIASTPPVSLMGVEAAEQEQNARLISAAPDMYEALRAIFEGTGMTGENMDKARAALAKAEGGGK